MRKELKEKVTHLEKYLGVRLVNDNNTKAKRFIRLGESILKYEDKFRREINK